MSHEKAVTIEQKILEFLQSRDGQPEDAAKLIKDATEALPDVDEWDVRKILWRLTADGRADFTPGFKQVLIRS